MQEVDEDRRYLPLLLVPTCRRDIILHVLWHQDVEFTVWQQPTRVLSHVTRMRPIIPGNHAGRHGNRAECFGARPDHGQVRIPQKVLAPVRHDTDKVLWIHTQETVTIGGIASNPFPEKLRLADRWHAALLRRLDELAIVVVCQALRCERTSWDPPQEERPDGLRMTQGEQQRQPAARGTAANGGWPR